MTKGNRKRNEHKNINPAPRDGPRQGPREDKFIDIIAKQFDVLLQQNMHLMQEIQSLKKRQKKGSDHQPINIYNQMPARHKDRRESHCNHGPDFDDSDYGNSIEHDPRSRQFGPLTGGNPLEQIINDALFGGGPPPDKIVIRITDPSKKAELESFFGKKKVPEEILDQESETIDKNPILDEDYEEFDTEIKTLDDLIALGETALKKLASVEKTKKPKRSCLDMETLGKLVGPLKKLKNMVGMENVKKNICNQIVYFLQKFEKANDAMMHTIIEGPPGVGKTELGRILGEVYLNMGLIKSSKFKIVKRADLIDRFLGHTAIKTQECIDDCDGGVLFIDEAYSLGNDEKQDIFSKECLDTLNMNLSENKTKFVCIIAGYADALENCFFAYNQGLKRRFPFKYTITQYKADELKDIFCRKVDAIKWTLSPDLKPEELLTFFRDNFTSFPNFGGDIETLMFKCKISHANRTFGKHPKLRKILTLEDIRKGFEMFLEHKKQKDEMSPSVQMMYG